MCCRHDRLKVSEVMMESIFAFDVPFQLLNLLRMFDKNGDARLEKIGPFLGQIETGAVVYHSLTHPCVMRRSTSVGIELHVKARHNLRRDHCIPRLVHRRNI